MINLSRVVNSPRFAQTLMVTRNSGAFVAGGYKATSQPPFGVYGTLKPAKPVELVQVPEGDRKDGAMSFISETQLFQTRTSGIGTASGLSDTATWRGKTYKVVSVDPWTDFGFWKHILTEQSGA